MTKKLKLTKIELETKDGEKVTLSLDEARELHGQLDELFGSKYVPTAPIIIERDRYPWPQPYYQPVWCNQPQGTAKPLPRAPEITCQVNGRMTGLSVTYEGSAL